MKRSYKLTIIVSLAIFCLIFSRNASADATIGQQSPSFVVVQKDGKKFDLSELKGKVVVVNFWTTWCPDCRYAMPALEAVWRQYHSQGLEMVGVNVDGATTRKSAKEVMSYFSFPWAMHDGISKNELATFDSVPKTFVIGKDGKVAHVMTDAMGPLSDTVLGEQVKALLNPKADKQAAEPEKEGDAK
jgi:cytochrome c biogenesis protein CcmG/thiol:disulfide interchange protein DsbE